MAAKNIGVEIIPRCKICYRWAIRTLIESYVSKLSITLSDNIIICFNDKGMKPSQHWNWAQSLPEWAFRARPAGLWPCGGFASALKLPELLNPNLVANRVINWVPSWDQ